MSVEITDKALKEIKKVMEEQQLAADQHVLRVGVTAGGCSGYSYSLGFDEVANVNADQDSVKEVEGLKVVVDKKSDLFLDGTTVDYHDGLEKRGFVFSNPNATKTCGCGSSFGV